MPSWEDLPEEIRGRFQPPPQRERFAFIEEYEEALGFWQGRIGRNIGMVMLGHSGGQKELTPNAIRKFNYARHAKMLVPKFACQSDGGWHIQWPKDDPHVVYALTREELVPLLATWLRQLERVGNIGKHVAAENFCPTCK